VFSEVVAKLPDILFDFSPGALQRDRPAWAAVPAPISDAVLLDAKKTLQQTWPLIRASDYREYVETGNRSRFEDLYFTRRRMLNNLVLGELLEGKGRFLAGIVDGIFLIAEEGGWQLPAHNSYERGGSRSLLPDVSKPVIDLFAAETSAQLATVVALMRDELDAVSPQIVSRIEREVEIRIFEPYLGRHFWWMGRDDERMNNWTAWITQNILLSVFCLRTDQILRRRVVEKALGSLDAFLKDYAEDGACEEGVVYYRHAALCLQGAMTILDSAAPGVVRPLWGKQKIRNMAEYILNMHAAGSYYFNFADSSAVVEPCSVREYLFGKAVGSETLMSFAAADRARAENQHLPQEWNLWYRVQELLLGPAVPRKDQRQPGRDILYPGIGLFIARDERYALAVKGGHNGESHNHNDVGSVTLYKDGRPFLIDVGVETYTAKTFSPKRYDIWTMQSAFHNLPTFGEVMQSDGQEFAARDLVTEFSSVEARISLDIAGAYPGEARVRSYQRTVSLLRGRHVEILDVFDGDVPAVLSLMTSIEPQISPGLIDLPSLGRIEVEGAGAIDVEPIEISDARLRISWPPMIYRLLVPLADKRLTLRIV